MQASSVNTLGAVRQKAVRLTLSLPVQVGLFTSLGALTLWTLYFSTYPPAHDAMHSVRHHTAMVSCH